MPERKKSKKDSTLKKKNSVEKKTSNSKKEIKIKKSLSVDSQKQEAFPIVGIGASAGGLKAFEIFFTAMPTDEDINMAFIIVQHLDPNHKSILCDLIRRYTRMMVFEVEDGMKVQPNCAYIIPPNCDMTFLNGSLQLMEPHAPRGKRLPIDFFFRSLAQDQHERAIGVVLSGSGSDGTLGVRAIKGEGGMIIAQTPESAEYDGMPRNAISTGLVDYILTPSEMPARLISYVKHAIYQNDYKVDIHQKQNDSLKNIFVLLRSHTGHDFSLYKHNTVIRRVERRMSVNQINNLDNYIKYLKKNTVEIDALFRDLLIGVTNFFRDPEAFEILKKYLIPSQINEKYGDLTIRIWVPACSTGEEAYSIAILAQERMEELKHGYKIKIFATDIDELAIEQARAGVFSASISSDISSERLARFFILSPDGNTYQIQKSIRDMLIFSKQDITKDPPFSRLDLISCRNLLIYMGTKLQKKVIPMFHYALKPDGKLFLGTSETVGDFVDLFSTLDRKSKLYQRSDYLGTHSSHIRNFIKSMSQTQAVIKTNKDVLEEHTIKLQELAERMILEHCGTVGIIINEDSEILYLHGRTGKFLEPVQGKSGMNIINMAREGLRQALTLAIHQVRNQNKVVTHNGVLVKTNGNYVTVNLTVRSVNIDKSDKSNPAILIVILDEIKKTETSIRHIDSRVAKDNEETSDSDAIIAILKDELSSKNEYLQVVTEELETTNEELRSSNEEMQSINEELQSTNEELETSREELQSTNEELITINAELQAKVNDLSQVNNDMNNLLSSTDIGTIFLDNQFRILRFTPAVTKVINLIPTDEGRPVSHIVSNLVGYDRLLEDVEVVLDSLIPKEKEVLTISGTWYLLRIRPYRTVENVIEGAVITFIDITEIKKAAEMTRNCESLQRLALVVRDSNDAIIMCDLNGCIIAWNPGAERLYGWNESEALTMNISQLIPDNIEEQYMNTINQLVNAEVIKPYRTKRINKDGEILEICLTASSMRDETGKYFAIATTERQSR